MLEDTISARPVDRSVGQRQRLHIAGLDLDATTAGGALLRRRQHFLVVVEANDRA